MDTDTITIPVPPDVAKAYREAPPDQQRVWNLLVQFYLREFATCSKRSLLEIMDEMGRQAAANGLTEEELNDILKEWDDERRR